MPTTTTMPKLRELRARLAALGYALHKQQSDCRGKRWRYRTSPTTSSGPINYFADKAALARYIRQVEQIRYWQGALAQLVESE